MKKITIIGILFTIIIGSLLHFTYEWFDYNNVIALFSAVNESTWEHLKLLFFPYVFYMLFEYFYIGKDYPNYVTAKVLGILVGLCAIPVIFNTYTSIVGTTYLILDILIFMVAVILSYTVSYYVLKKQSITFPNVSIIIFIILIMAFFIFTFRPPTCNIFLDPITAKEAKFTRHLD